VNTSGKQKTATPLGIMVAAANGDLATVPLRRDAHGYGYVATLDGVTYHVTATLTGPTA
jgi:hypothetical protein